MFYTGLLFRGGVFCFFMGSFPSAGASAMVFRSPGVSRFGGFQTSMTSKVYLTDPGVRRQGA